MVIADGELRLQGGLRGQREAGIASERHGDTSVALGRAAGTRRGAANPRRGPPDLVGRPRNWIGSGNAGGRMQSSARLVKVKVSRVKVSRGS